MKEKGLEIDDPLGLDEDVEQCVNGPVEDREVFVVQVRELLAEDMAGLFPRGTVLGEDCVAKLGLIICCIQYYFYWEEGKWASTDQEGTATLGGNVSITPDNSSER